MTYLKLRVDVLLENRHLVVEHLYLEHPLSKGDIIWITHDNEYKGYEVVKCMITVGKSPRKSVGQLHRTEIIVKKVE